MTDTTTAKPKRAAKAAISKSLEATLWDSAEEQRGKVEPGEYKHVVLGLIFLKYVSDTFMVRHTELARLVNDPESDYYMPSDDAKRSVLEDRDEYTAEGVFWIPEGHRWDDLRKAAKQPDIGKRIDSAMDAIERENPVLKGVLPKNYARQELLPEMLGGLIDVFSRKDLAAEEYKDLDVLGRVYEYFLGKFASQEGKAGGEFYTPRHVVQLLVEMLRPYRGRVFDPACGSGGMFVQADKFVRAHGGNRNDLAVYGQEGVPTTWKLAKMNLALRGIDANLGNEWGDSFHNDKHPDLRADYIIANPPFNQKKAAWHPERLRGDVRWKYGEPTGEANYAWIQHMLHHLAPTGTMGTLLANGSLTSAQNNEDEIRKNLIEADHVECIVALPKQLFFGTQIPVCAWFLTKNKAAIPNGNNSRPRRRETLFIDARQLGFMATRTQREFSPDDIAKVVNTYHAWRGTTEDGRDVSTRTYEDVAGFCRSVITADIAAHGYALAPGRYVGSEEVEDDREPLDEKIGRLSADIRDRFRRRSELQQLVIEALNSLEPNDE